MLTIENINKIFNKPLGKKNFYVNSMDIVDTYWYIIEITNRKMITNIYLKRTPMPNGYYEMDCQYTNKAVTMNRAQLENLDVFLDKIRFVGIK
jgi:hypothetical protein